MEIDERKLLEMRREYWRMYDNRYLDAAAGAGSIFHVLGLSVYPRPSPPGTVPTLEERKDAQQTR